MTQPIKPESFRDLVSSGVVTSVQIAGRKGGYAVLADIGRQRRPLGTRQGEVRMFSTADTALKLLHDLGMYHAQVDTSKYEEGRLRPARPDIARKSREARAALEHDRWFRAQVRGTLDAIEAGTEPLLDSETAWADLRVKARALDVGKTKAPAKPRKAPTA